MASPPPKEDHCSWSQKAVSWAVLRLVSAVLMETDERWLTGRRYLNMNVEQND